MTNQISLEQIVDLGGSDIIIDPKKLTCSICCCININAKECLNKKCQKLICETCYLSFKNRKIANCPFCRLDFNYTKADQKLLDIIATLKLYCEHNTCKEKISIDDFENHNKKIRSINKCNNCQSTDNKLQKCNICGIFSCFNCKDIILSCFNCQALICNKCCDKSNSKQNNILCGLCNTECNECNSKAEAKVVCYMCDKLLCKDCMSQCEECQLYICKDKCYKVKSTKCEDCTKLPMEKFYNKCAHLIYQECAKCYPKCQRSSNGLKPVSCGNKSNLTCSGCNQKTCLKDCILKCKSCKQNYCKSCIKVCLVCKKQNCTKCLNSCDMCGNTVSCTDCNTDTIRTCNQKGCSVKLCLNCWNVCNTCNVLYCKDHSITCIDCEENCCNKHIHKCTKCATKDDKFKLLCLKRCTNICSFCGDNMNSLCNAKNHNNVNISKLNCGHTTCSNCNKTCGKCNKIVISCQICIVNFYFHKCKICEIYLCSVCSKFCKKCEDIYCTQHSCYSCKKKGVTCSNCELNLRCKCYYCGKHLQPCEICNKLYFCNALCYKKVKENKSDPNKHLCEFYSCDDCVFKLKLKNLDKHYLDIGSSYNNDNDVASRNSRKEKGKVKNVGCGKGACYII
jgi:hypothetical protein